MNDEAKLALSQLLASEGAFEDSARIPLGMVQSQPANLPAVEQLASIFSDAGDAERLAPAVARLRAQALDRASTRYYSAALAYMQQRPDIAIREAEAALAIDPAYARAQNVLGAALAGVGQRDRARAAFVSALRLDPRDPATYSNLATLELEAGNVGAARQLFARGADARSVERSRARGSHARADAVAIQFGEARSKRQNRIALMVGDKRWQDVCFVADMDDFWPLLHGL